MDVEEVRTAPGVVAVYTAADVPGINDASPVAGDDPVFAEDLVEYVGQALFLVAAESVAAARAAAKLATVEYESLPALVSVDDAMKAESFVLPSRTLLRGDPDAAMQSAPHQINGRMEIGGQDHFYLESHVALATPREDGDVHVYSSTQHPTEVQHNVAKFLDVPDHSVTVEVRRMGGGFGGKETQGAWFAAMVALGRNDNWPPGKNTAGPG